MNVGDIVVFRNPHEDEKGDTFRVLEDRGDRVLVEDASEFWDGYTIRPTHVYLKAELKKEYEP